MKKILFTMAWMLCSIVPALAEGIDWKCNPADYRYDMTVYASLVVNADTIVSDDYTLAAFCGEECRGVASVGHVDGKQYYYLRVRSNQLRGDSITFRAYNNLANEEVEPCWLRTGLKFESLSRIGYPSETFAVVFKKPIDVNLIPYNINKEYGDANPELTYTVGELPEGVAIEWIGQPTLATDATKDSKVGEYEITISGGELKNAIDYRLIYGKGSLTINKAPLKLFTTNYERTYGKENSEMEVLSEGFKLDETFSVLSAMPIATCTATEESNVGLYDIAISKVTSENYDIVYSPGKLSVVKAEVSLVLKDTTKIYGDENPEFSLVVPNGLKIDWITQPNIICDATIKSKVGEYSITASGGEALNHNVAFTVGKLVVQKASLKLYTDDYTRKYGEANPEMPVLSSGWKFNDTITELSPLPRSFSSATGESDVGEYDITISEVSADNYEITYIPGKLTITKADLTLRVKDTTRVYGEENPMFEMDTPKAFVWITEPTITCEASSQSNVGVYEITATGGESQNHNVTFTNGKLTITKAKAIVDLKDTSRVYGYDNPAFAIVMPNELNIEWLTQPTVTTDATVSSKVGDYIIVATGGEAKNHLVSFNNGKLTVTKAALKLYTEDYTRKYGEANPEIPVLAEGFKLGDGMSVLSPVPSATCPAITESEVGVYGISISETSAENYEINYAPGKLSVDKADITFAVKDATREYGEENPTFEIAISEGFVAEWTTAPSIVCVVTPQSNVGEYAITATGGVMQNYDVSITAGNLNVTKAPLKVYSGNYTRTYAEENPTFEVLYDGFKLDDNPSIFTETPVATTAATKESNVGEYVIEISQEEATNYALSYASGTLTIVKANQTINWTMESTNVNIGDSINLNASASSGLAVTYTSSDENIAKVKNGVLIVLADGTFSITASQTGNGNYNSAEDVTITFCSIVTGFNTIFMQKSKNAIYTINGVRVQSNNVKNLAPGIYLIGEKKVIVK